MKRRQILRQKQRAQSRRKRLLIISGVLLLAVLATTALILQGPRPTEEVGEIVQVTPQTWPAEDGKALGPADAPVVVVEYADFQCPFCRQYHDQVQPRLIEDYIQSGKVRYEYRHLIVIDRNVGGTESRRAAEASQCALDQGRFWDYAEILFANQGREGSGAFSDARLEAFAGAIGLDTEQFNACLDSDRFSREVQSDEAQAASLQLRGTPSVLVNGARVENPLSYAQLQAAVDAALAEAGS
jgi:protein-disulfide isomerase